MERASFDKWNKDVESADAKEQANMADWHDQEGLKHYQEYLKSLKPKAEKMLRDFLEKEAGEVIPLPTGYAERLRKTLPKAETPKIPSGAVQGECKYCNNPIHSNEEIMHETDPFSDNGIYPEDNTKYPWHTNCYWNRRDDV